MILSTVRAKLTALVLLSVFAMLATLPVLSWMLHAQLIAAVDDRVADAEVEDLLPFAGQLLLGLVEEEGEIRRGRLGGHGRDASSDGKA